MAIPDYTNRSSDIHTRNKKEKHTNGKITMSSIFMLIVGVSVGYFAFATIQVPSNADLSFQYEQQQQHKSAMKSFQTNRGGNGNAGIIPNAATEGRTVNVRRSLEGSNDNNEVSTEAAQKRFVENQQLLASQSIPTSTTPNVMKTPKLPDSLRKKIMVTGGAGFVGSHLVDKLMMKGHEVIVVDNFFTGQKKNVEHWLHHPNFRWV